MLPTAGSGMLRETARVLAAQAEELVRAANMALQQGNERGAKAVAEKALEADPNNADAQVARANHGQSTDHSESATTRLAVLVTIPLAAPATIRFGRCRGQPPAKDPFGCRRATMTRLPLPAPAAPTPKPPAPAPPRADTAQCGDSSSGSSRTGRASCCGSAPRGARSIRDAAGLPVGDDELLEQPGDLLDRVQAQRAAEEGRWRAEVRAQLREAQPIVANRSDRACLVRSRACWLNLEAAPDISPQLRNELAWSGSGGDSGRQSPRSSLHGRSAKSRAASTRRRCRRRDCSKKRSVAKQRSRRSRSRSTH